MLFFGYVGHTEQQCTLLGCFKVLNRKLDKGGIHHSKKLISVIGLKEQSVKASAIFDLGSIVEIKYGSL